MHILTDLIDSRRYKATVEDAPEEDDDEAAAQHAQVDNGPHSSRRRPRLSDFDEYSRPIIELAQDHYRLAISTKDAFPAPVTDAEFVARSWNHACQEFDAMLLLSPDIEKLVCYLLRVVILLSSYCSVHVDQGSSFSDAR